MVATAGRKLNRTGLGRRLGFLGCILAALCLICPPALAQAGSQATAGSVPAKDSGTPLEFRFLPAYSIPFGVTSGVFGAANLSASLDMGFGGGFLGLPWLGPVFSLGYAESALASGGSSLTSLEAQLGLAAKLSLLASLDLRAGLFGRYASYSLVQGAVTTRGASPGLSLDLGLEYRVGTWFGLGLGARGSWDFGMAGFVRPYISATYTVGGPASEAEGGTGAASTVALPVGKAESPSGGPLTLRLVPAYAIPLGAAGGVFGPANYSGNIILGLGEGLFGLSWLHPELAFGYANSSLASGGSTLEALEAFAGLGAGLPLLPGLDLRLAFHVRYASYRLVQAGATTIGPSPGIDVDLGVDYSLGPATSIGLGALGGWDLGMVGFIRPYLAFAYRVGDRGRGSQGEGSDRIAASTGAAGSGARAGGPLRIRLMPSYGVPIGAVGGVFGADNVGGTMALEFGSGLFGLSWLRPQFGLGYAESALAAGGSTLSALEAGLGLGGQLPLLAWLDLRLGLSGRLSSYSLVQGGATTIGSSPGIGAEIGVEFRLSPWLGLGVGALGSWDFGMLGFVRPYLAAAYRVGPGAAPHVAPKAGPAPKAVVAKKTPEQAAVPPSPPAKAAPPPSPSAPAAADQGPISASLDGIFPVFYKYYDENPFGTLTIRNTGRTSWSDLKVSLAVRQVMDSARTFATIPSLAPGETRSLEATALFNDSILGITEATKVSCELTLEYREGGKTQRVTRNVTLRVYDRNALTWADDRSAAGFVTSRDPVVLSLAKSLAGDVNAAKNPAINTKLQLAAAIHDALCLYGVNYVTDPTSVYSGSKARSEVDFLQFPRQTLEYRAGDCDDLTILYCAFLEAIGVETAFITVPGHIYMAASLDLGMEEARLRFGRIDDLVFVDGLAWVPIEVTMRTGGFLAAWTEGAKEWREANARGKAAFTRVHKAWEDFEPVALPGSASLPPLANAKAVAAMRSDIEAFILRDIADKAAKLQADIRNSQGSPRAVNALGLLYAQYGLYDKAKNQFDSILAKEDYAPALVNLGNIQRLRGDNEGALALYERAYRKSPASPAVLLALAVTNQGLENYGVVKRYYQELRKADPALAERYSFLDIRGEEGSKAAEAAGLKGAIEWMEGK